MDANKHFKLADEKYQQLKINIEKERSKFTEKLEYLKKEIEIMNGRKFIFVP